MNKMINTLIFFAGTAIGGVVTWFYTKEKYAAIADEEIQSVKMAYAARLQQLTNKATKTTAAQVMPPEKPDLAGYSKKLQEEGYTDYSSTVAAKTPKPEEQASDGPYVITPDEFGEIEEYTKISLSYFADGVLADDNNEEVDDVEEIVGDALAHFGEYEEDAVYVRNDAKKCDYEILMDIRKFEDVLADMPPR